MKLRESLRNTVEQVRESFGAGQVLENLKTLQAAGREQAEQNYESFKSLAETQAVYSLALGQENLDFAKNLADKRDVNAIVEHYKAYARSVAGILAANIKDSSDTVKETAGSFFKPAGGGSTDRS